MNIFHLSNEPELAAKYHCDKHVVKMIVEGTQMLSTCHRVLDGINSTATSEYILRKNESKQFKKPKNIKYLPEFGESVVSGNFTSVFLNETHANHPSTIWTRATSSNYRWHVQMIDALHDEYTKRYGKIHSLKGMLKHLWKLPHEITEGGLTPFATAMPEQYIQKDAVQAYRNYYKGEKSKFAKWKLETPFWW